MTSEITYEQLEKALASFGFHRKNDPDHFILLNPKNGGIIALAEGESDTMLRPAYQRYVQSEVVERGLGTQEELEQALHQAGAVIAPRVRPRPVVARAKSKAKAATPA